MLVITGTGRSGTSALAGWFKELGLLKDPGSYIHKINGGYENPKTVAINDKLMNYEKVSDEEIKSINLPVVKDPRLFYRRVLDRWLAVRNDLSFLVCCRESRKTILSTERHPDHFKHKIATSTEEKVEDQYKIYGYFFSTVIGKNLPIQTISFPYYLDEFDLVCKKVEMISDLKLDREKAKEAWDKCMDKDKVHIK